MTEIETDHDHHPTAEDDRSSAPVHAALLSGDVSRGLQLLKHGASPHGRGKRKMTLLHIAAINGFKSVAEQLLLQGAAVDPVEDDFWTPLHLASGHGHALMVELLLQHGAGINIQDDEGWTALHQAVGSHAEVVKLLLQNGADPTLKTSAGQTPLDRGRERMNKAACRLLAEHKHASYQSYGLRTLCKACRGITFKALSAPLRKQPNSSSKQFIAGYLHSQSYADLLQSASSCVLCMHIQHSITQTVKPENGPICLHFEEDAAKEGHLFILIWFVDLDCWFASGNRLGVTADEGSAAAVHGKFINRPLPSNALDERNIAAIKRWLSLCASSHRECQVPKNHVKPKRLLDLEPTGSEHSCVLVDTAGMDTVSWAALSYCWGSRPAQITERATIANFQHPHGIDVNNSPKTCQDAIRTVRALGIRYLWIDALCIVQDDTDDWQAEASKMGDIYRNAAVTIAATGSINTKSGFLSERMHDDYLKIPYDGPGSREGDYFYVHAPPSTISHTVENTTWNKRGWTMQERFLSRNVVHFTASPVVLECREGTWTELHLAGTTDWLETPDAQARAFRNTTVLDMGGSRFVSNTASMSSWEAIVLGFCGRSFTFPDDKAWALAGLVRDFERQTGLRYVEGIWLPALDGGADGGKDTANGATHAADEVEVKTAEPEPHHDPQPRSPSPAAHRPKRWTTKLLSRFKSKSTPQPTPLPPRLSTNSPPSNPSIEASTAPADDIFTLINGPSLLSTSSTWHASPQHQLLYHPTGPLRTAPRPRAPSWSWLALDGRLRHFDRFGMAGCVPVGTVTFETADETDEFAKSGEEKDEEEEMEKDVGMGAGRGKTVLKIRAPTRWFERGKTPHMGKEYGGTEPVFDGRVLSEVHDAVFDWYYLHCVTSCTSSETTSGPKDNGDGGVGEAVGVAVFDVDDPPEGRVLAVRLGDEVGWRGSVKALLLVRDEGRGGGAEREVWRRVGVAEFGSAEGFGEGVEREVVVV